MKILTAMLALSLAGCAVAPKSYTFSDTRVMQLTPEDAHSRAIQWLVEHGMTISAQNAAITVGQGPLDRVDGYRRSAFSAPDNFDSLYFDCGKQGLGVIMAHEGTITVTTNAGAVMGSTSVKVTFTPRNPSNTCNSTGKLEPILLNYIQTGK